MQKAMHDQEIVTVGRGIEFGWCGNAETNLLANACPACGFICELNLRGGKIYPNHVRHSTLSKQNRKPASAAAQFGNAASGTDGGKKLLDVMFAEETLDGRRLNRTIFFFYFCKFLPPI